MNLYLHGLIPPAAFDYEKEEIKKVNWDKSRCRKQGEECRTWVLESYKKCCRNDVSLNHPERRHLTCKGSYRKKTCVCQAQGQPCEYDMIAVREEGWHIIPNVLIEFVCPTLAYPCPCD